MPRSSASLIGQRRNDSNTVAIVLADAQVYLENVLVMEGGGSRRLTAGSHGVNSELTPRNYDDDRESKSS